MPTDLEIAFIDYLNAVALFLERSLDQASSQDAFQKSPVRKKVLLA